MTKIDSVWVVIKVVTDEINYLNLNISHVLIFYIIFTESHIKKVPKAKPESPIMRLLSIVDLSKTFNIFSRYVGARAIIQPSSANTNPIASTSLLNINYHYPI